MISIEKNKFRIENSMISRTLIFSNEYGLATGSFFNKTTGREYCKEVKSCEFVIAINGKVYLGYKPLHVHPVNGNTIVPEQSFELISASKNISPDREILLIKLNIPKANCVLELQYEIMKDHPSMRKSLKVTNNSLDSIHVNYLYFDSLNCYPGELADIEVFNEYCLNKIDKTSYGDNTQAMLQLHNTSLGEGVIVSCDSPCSCKRICAYLNWQDTAVLAGYNSDTIPFNKYLSPGESFQSHSSYVLFYSGAQNAQSLKNSFTDYIRAYLPAYEKSETMYCTWIPFLKEINEKLILDLADKAHEIGFDYFLIDDGWFTPGWNEDENKFPSGLKKVSAAIHIKGMKFGLWFNLGSAYGSPSGHDKHLAKNLEGTRCHGLLQNDKLICLASGYRKLVADRLVRLAAEYNVDYFKLDFTTTRCVYGFASVGCTSTEHEFHRNWSDSVIGMYEGMKYVKERIQKEKPGIIVDFTFESFGDQCLPDISSIQFSDLHHVSNHNTNHRTMCLTPLDIRNFGYRVCNMLPPERILLSLICFEGDNSVENMMTSFISTPLLSGDLRKLSHEEIQKGAALISAYKAVSAKGQLKYLAKLKNDKFPYHDEWDGFTRFNGHGEGLLFLFRNKSKAQNIRVSIDMGLIRCQGIRFLLNNIFTGNCKSTVTHGDLKNGIDMDFGNERVLIYSFITRGA